MKPDPLKEWFLEPHKQSRLIEILNDPIYKEAQTVLHAISLPKPDFSQLPSAETITNAAMEQKRNAGFFSYPDHLWEMTEPPKKPPVKPQGYSDSYVKEWAKKNGMWEDFEQTEQQS